MNTLPQFHVRPGGCHIPEVRPLACWFFQKGLISRVMTGAWELSMKIGRINIIDRSNTLKHRSSHLGKYSVYSDTSPGPSDKSGCFCS
jgi:hypothetical protein